MKGLPPDIQKLFWDMDSSKLDAQKHADIIIERVLNTGSLHNWKWLVANYGSAAIQTKLSKKSVFERDNIRTESRRLASLIMK